MKAYFHQQAQAMRWVIFLETGVSGDRLQVRGKRTYALAIPPAGANSPGHTLFNATEQSHEKAVEIYRQFREIRE